MFSRRTDWNLETNKLSQALDRFRLAGKSFIDLTRSNPTECGFKFDEQQILTALANPAALKYEPHPQGLLSARQSVAGYYSSRGEQVSPDDIFLVTGTSEAYSFIFCTLCDAGDEILIPQPGYPLFNFLGDIQGVRLAHYQLLYDHGWHIDFHSVEKAISARSRAIVVVHPNNPTGHFCSSAQMARLVELCSKKNLAIIADEVFLDFNFAAPHPRSFATAGDALTLVMSGLSKISALPQMKLGWLCVSGPHSLKTGAISRLEMIADTYLSLNTPVQLALPALLEQRHAFRRQWLERAATNLESLDKALASQRMCSRLQIEGGWYAVLKVPAVANDEDLALQLLLEKGVYVHPGHFYDFATEGYLVVSLITSEQEFAAGVRALITFFTEKLGN